MPDPSGEGGATTSVLCEIVDGELAYGPIGEPQPASRTMLPPDECEGQPDAAPPVTALGDCVFWTGSRYLTAFADPRGVVVASLDEVGAVIREETISPQTVETVSARFARNGGRVLVVLRPGASAPSSFAVLDLEGTPMAEVQPLVGEDYPQIFDLAIVPNHGGWLVALSYNNPSTGWRGLLLTRVSREGLVRQERAVPLPGYVSLSAFTESAYGGTLLVGDWDEGGQFGAWYSMVAWIDDSLEVVYLEGTQEHRAATWPLSIIEDPERDLVIARGVGENSDSLVVQEYGCL